MSREIKFRAWDKKNKEMCYLPENQSSELVFTEKPFRWFYWRWGRKLPETEKEKNNPEFNVVDFNFVDADLMQYTGLKDKNGKEIYEGDIVKCETITFPKCKVGSWTIKWNAYMWGVIRNFGAFYEGGTEKGGFEKEKFLWQNYDRMEIIGNIYENKELLK